MAPDIQLIVGDSVAGMNQMPEQSINLVVTSPPYNLGIKYRKYKDDQKRAIYLAWTEDWVKAVHRVMADNGSFFLNVGAAPKNPMLPHEIVFVVTKYFKIQNTFHWIKAVTVETTHGQELNVGHFKPISSPRFVNDCHEYVFHLTKTGHVPINRKAVGVPYTDKSNIKRWASTGGSDLRCRGNTWFIPYKTIKSRDKQRPHPATFPAKLAEYCIRVHGGTTSELTVIDPFVGIGNSAKAAKDLGVKKFIGFDIDEEYIKESYAKIA